MRVIRLLAALGTILLIGAPIALAQSGSDKNRIDQLEKRLDALERRIAAVEPPSPEKEQKARGLLSEVQQLAAQGDYTTAKARLATLNSDYRGTAAQRQAGRFNQEFAVIGKAAPASYAIEKWYQGETEVNLGSSKPTLLVFWEQWCPHCQREVPKMEEIYNTYKGKGLQVVGLTKITKSATEQKVLDFIKQRNVSYPMAKETGGISQYFNVSGIPAAAVVKDGKVVWRGHPGQINDQMLASWVGG